MTPTDYLKRPYSRLVIREEDGSFRAEILEFPGCIALADTDVDALRALEDVALSWIAGTIESGKEVPEPIEVTAYSGRFVTRLPKSLHRKISYAAQREGVSLNTYIVAALAAHVSAPDTLRHPVPVVGIWGSSPKVALTLSSVRLDVDTGYSTFFASSAPSGIEISGVRPLGVQSLPAPHVIAAVNPKVA
ncbi:toxin-antitoxin system HicB family antitoxin [Reyranella sp.]|uniref:toxin-antitoxin system HicB family antitoxin n=1 Tax=Reyranella sp. TaxID=1929291 RepID=UPI003D11EB64